MRPRRLERGPVIHDSVDDGLVDLEQIHLYFCDLDAQAQRGDWDESVLSAQEWQQADRRRDRHRRRFVTGRLILRTLLARALDRDPRQVALTQNAFGKPVLAAQELTAGPTGRLHFNVSHREHVLMIGLSARGELGVDVELMQPVADADRLASDHLTPEQARAVRALPREQKAAQLYRAWTLKEATVKAVGTCIALGVDVKADDLPEKCLSCHARNSGPADERLFQYWQQEVAVAQAAAMACVVLATR